MIDWILSVTDLTFAEFAILIGVTVLAGIVRGFSGFALSAMVMATAVVILPPVELIPMLWWLEMSASLLMLKNGWAGADRKMTFGLVGGSFIGWPIGLAMNCRIACWRFTLAQVRRFVRSIRVNLLPRRWGIPRWVA